MQSSFKILSALFRLLNVAEVNDVIDGKVMIGEPANNRQTKDVSVNLINNPNLYVQNGYCNVNIHVPKINGVDYNYAALKQLSEIIIPLVEDSEITTPDGTFYFQIDDDKGVFNDDDRDGMSYYNLRLEFQTIK